MGGCVDVTGHSVAPRCGPGAVPEFREAAPLEDSGAMQYRSSRSSSGASIEPIVADADKPRCLLSEAEQKT